MCMCSHGLGRKLRGSTPRVYVCVRVQNSGSTAVAARKKGKRQAGLGWVVYRVEVAKRLRLRHRWFVRHTCVGALGFPVTARPNVKLDHGQGI
jgi:hypothetical protein